MPVGSIFSLALVLSLFFCPALRSEELLYGPKESHSKLSVILLNEKTKDIVTLKWEGGAATVTFRRGEKEEKGSLSADDFDQAYSRANDVLLLAAAAKNLSEDPLTSVEADYRLSMVSAEKYAGGSFSKKEFSKDAYGLSSLLKFLNTLITGDQQIP